MDGPRPIDETIGTREFRNHMADYLDKAKTGSAVFLLQRKTRATDMAVVVSPDVWRGLGFLKRELTGYSTKPNGTGGFLTRTQLAVQLQAESDHIGEETHQITAGEMRLITGLIAELGRRYPDEPLGELAQEWAVRLGTRTAPTV